jgi:hypothetical protein
MTHNPAVNYWAYRLVWHELLTGEVTQWRVIYQERIVLGTALMGCMLRKWPSDPTSKATA